MPDYQQMYLTMVSATEKAMNILIEAQQACEKLYLSENETIISVLPTPWHTEEDDSLRSCFPAAKNLYADSA